MNKKTTFLQMTFWVGDEESPSHYLIIIEIVNDVPINAIITQFPRAPWQFARYPYASN